MIQHLDIKQPDGVTPFQAPWIEYDISETESVGVIGIDLNKSSSSPIPEHPEVKMSTPGKLSDEPLERDLIQRIQESLRKDGWDFEKYPNPELILITQKTEDEVLQSEFPFDKSENFYLETNDISIINRWKPQVESKFYPSAKTLWPEVPNWESIILALIKWSKNTSIPFDDILSYGLLSQEHSGVAIQIPRQIRTWAYERFKSTFK